MNPILSLLTLVPLLSFGVPREDPSPQTSIVGVAVEAGNFNTLLAAATAAGLAETLSSQGPFTIFAPTDEAFAKLPKGVVESLLRPENKAKLVEVLSFHVVSGSVFAADAIMAKRAPALAGGDLNFSISDGRMRVNAADVIANDIRASNGVVHVIDSVLSPPSGLAVLPTGRLVVGIYTERPSRALCAQLGIDRSSSLLITKLTDGTSKQAGMQQYDVLLSIAGKPATDKQLKAAKADAQFGGVIEFVFLRNGQKMTKHVKVGVEQH